LIDNSWAFEKRIALLEGMAAITERMAHLVENLHDPADSDEFDRLLLERQACILQIDEIDGTTQIGMDIDAAHLPGLTKLLEKIAAHDNKITGRLRQEASSIKEQMGEQASRKKSMLTYNTNILARNSMVLDESK
jgi:hypothetical protein